MRISIAQINYHIANFELNRQLIINALEKAKSENSDIIVFSELAITGYPPMDLLESEEFIMHCNKALDLIAKECFGLVAIIGAPTINKRESGKRLFNSALVIENGIISHTINKSLLPSYDIFDEYRYFEANTFFKVISIKGKNVGITICEDLWDQQGFENEFACNSLYKVSPMDELQKLCPELIINISASPFSATKAEQRIKIFTGKAVKHKLPIFNCNQVGGNTELIFEGASLVVSPTGEIFEQLNSFKEDFATYNYDDVVNSSKKSVKKTVDKINSTYDALVLGTRDYFKKMNFHSGIIGLSGGIDSAVCLCIAAQAIGADRLRVIALPSMYSSQHSIDDAVALAINLGVKCDIVNISDSYFAINEALKPIFAKLPEDITEENIQARIRSVLLMAISNKFGNILINTSNKSEAAVGYGTLYGDMAGGFSILGDVYKTDVFNLALKINKEYEIIPNNTITKPPSAELKLDQKDSDFLPDYKILDSIIYQYVELQKPLERIIGEGITNDLKSKVIKMIDNSEYKRKQAPPILRISSKAFGVGRRMPLVAKYKHS